LLLNRSGACARAAGSSWHPCTASASPPSFPWPPCPRPATAAGSREQRCSSCTRAWGWWGAGVEARRI
jgi:hypothetical protein